MFKKRTQNYCGNLFTTNSSRHEDAFHFIVLSSSKFMAFWISFYAKNACETSNFFVKASLRFAVKNYSCMYGVFVCEKDSESFNQFRLFLFVFFSQNGQKQIVLVSFYLFFEINCARLTKNMFKLCS